MRWSQPPIGTERKTSLSSKWFAKRKSRHKLKNEIKKRRHWKPFNCRNREKSQQGQLGRGSRTDGCTYTYTHVVLVLCNCYLGKKIREKNTERAVCTTLCDFLHLTYTWMGQREATFAFGLQIIIINFIIIIIMSSRWTSLWYWCMMRATVRPANVPLSSFLLRIFSNSQKWYQKSGCRKNPTERTHVWWELHDEMRVHTAGNAFSTWQAEKQQHV